MSAHNINPSVWDVSLEGTRAEFSDLCILRSLSQIPAPGAIVYYDDHSEILLHPYSPPVLEFLLAYSTTEQEPSQED